MNSFYLKAAVGAAGAVAAFFYFRFSSIRWRALIELSFQYHRHHLILLQQDHMINQRSREMATGMLWVMDKQLPRDELEGKVNLRGLFRSMMVGGTSLQLLGDTYFQIYRYRYEIDKRIPRLLVTVSSLLYRVFFVHSIVMPLALLQWDLKLLAAHLPFFKGGPVCLYRDLYADYRRRC